MLETAIFVCFNFFSDNVILDASFSENFYGLRRVTCDAGQLVTSHGTAVGGSADRTVTDDTPVSGNKVRHLTRTARLWSLFFLVSIMLQLQMHGKA